LHAALAAFVGLVLDRLAETRLPKTPLAEEWNGIAAADAEERDFCKIAARIGLDPYSVADETADDIIRTAGKIPDEIAEDFFDSVELVGLKDAANWTLRAMSAADRASAKATQSIRAIHKALSLDRHADDERPWLIGYGMARALRRELGVRTIDHFDISPWVWMGNVHSPAHGIYGVATLHDNQCGVVLGDQNASAMAKRFGQARALGRILASPSQRSFVLSTARSQDERVARAFAAELLAPAEGIRSALDAIGSDNESAIEAVARRFMVSPLLIQHQYDNQLTSQ
jgi:hypothetical protein